MKSFLASIAILSLFASCNTKDDLNIEIGNGVTEVSDTSYSFVKIEYYARDDSREITTSNNYAITYSNGTSVEQRYSFNPFEGFAEETSLFESEDIESLYIKGVEVLVPVYIDESGNIYLGIKKWEYSRNAQHQKSANNFSMDVVIPPNKVATTTAKLYFNTYKANYKLFLKGDQTGKEKIIEGVWTGIYADHFEGNTSYSDL